MPMLTPDPSRERPRSREDVRRAGLLPQRLAGFRRLYRWLNLTLVHQGLWPLLLVLVAAPAVPVVETPLPWYLARLAGPALAALLAAFYLVQKPAAPATASAPDGPDTRFPGDTPRVGSAPGTPDPGMPSTSDARAPRLAAARIQVGPALVGIAIVLAVARLVVGPTDSVAKLLAFGVADVLAFQLVHFGVVARSWPDPEVGANAAVGLFAASWGLRELFLAAAGSVPADLSLAFVGGAVVGLTIGSLSWLLRRWPGGFWPAAAAHFTLVYLVAGFS